MAPFRLARTAVFAVVCLGLGVTAHVLGGGSVPVPAMVAALGLSFAAAYPLSGRERSFAAILPLLAGLQVILHLLFSLSHAASPHALAGHLHSGLVPDLGMLVAHGWAVGMTALWLARGEAALWALLRRLAVRLLVIRLPLLATTPFSTSLGTTEPPVLRSAVLRHVVSRRGPPRAATA
ncbi:MFS transporter [Nonomuraea gerenzanensis]|uniref:Putative integral membrane protein n=1 Tax=Nonomuraea gerenzanensis TaxID=93944 RepID=A0A1M4DX61_9ACTN|nr:MFS transporter [Nonomuraea gerenzanensis]UBU13507.1 MFS transporter [Nonomuraea gerenzanensis]SBO91168.1 putative integral membrane protein [Nonomuraea gerenzanensis]